jgi:hydroxyacyl-ACP dehydratase HTD2-like protein with hotdog domain
MNVGDTLPELVREPTELQLFAFSAATWNTHRIHYDREYAREAEGYPDILVQSHLHACFLAQAVAQAFGPAARLTRLGWQNRGMAVPGDRLTVTARVAAVDEEGTRIDLELEERTAAGAVCVKGWATVERPKGAG